MPTPCPISLPEGCPFGLPLDGSCPLRASTVAEQKEDDNRNIYLLNPNTVEINLLLWMNYLRDDVLSKLMLLLTPLFL